MCQKIVAKGLNTVKSMGLGNGPEYNFTEVYLAFCMAG